MKNDFTTALSSFFGYAGARVLQTRLAQKTYANAVVPLVVGLATKSPKMAAVAFQFRELVEASLSPEFDIKDYKKEATRSNAVGHKASMTPAFTRG
ncbi:MAG: hypothetical protein WC612_06925 [Bdellovibrionales bacterium]|jgi:hypothetical protein